MTRNALLVLGAVLFCLAALRDGIDRWVETTVLPDTLSETSTEMRDRDGALLRVYTVDTGVWRLRPDLAQVDPAYVAALLRYEDKRFRQHAGLDPWALLRAGAQAVRHGRPVSGASTLTMQVARLLENGSTGRWAGKLRQIRVALALERRLSKSDILTLYLTHAPYGGGLEGIRAATLAWFGKEPARLTPAQIALLIALPQAPESRRPDRHPTQARAARDRVLSRLQRTNLVTEEQARAAAMARLPDRMRPFPTDAPHLADRLRRATPDRARHDLTLSAPVQAAMQDLVAEAARRAGPRISAALLVADHHSGDIIASVGSPAYDGKGARQGYVDMTRALRSPGSTLKPLVYGLAFDAGLAHPDTLINDGPVRFGSYAPTNFDGRFRGDVRVRDALRLSLNIPVVKLTQEIGPARLMAALRRAGAQPRLPGGRAGLAVSLGGVGISLHDLVQIYAVLAQGGQGPVLRANSTESPAQAGPILSDVAVWQVGDILADLPPPAGAPPGRIAYKTGTSYGHRDAWAIGFDGRHVIGVWMGRADGTPVPGAFGGDFAAPVLFDAFGRLKPAADPLPPPPAATLTQAGALLPPPLRRFRPRDTHFAAPAGGPEIVFPPDGAVLGDANATLTIKLRGGAAPYVLLANGRPVATGQRRSEFDIANPGTGFSTLVLVDGQGRTDRVSLRID